MAGEFWSRVDRAGRDDCWPWRGHIDKDGYGRVCLDKRMRPAHTHALELATGARKPAGLDTCHSCNNRACCNPRHLRFDTRAGNVADAIAAGTQHRFPPRLSDAQVVDLRERRAGGAAQQDLASLFGITDSMVSLLVHGKRRSDVGGPIETHRRYVRRG